MAQGLLKKSKATGPKRGTNTGPKRMNPKAIAPKSAALIKQKKLTKKLTSGMTARTEKVLAERAGHLELLAGGKKDKKKTDNKNTKGGK
ncbi:hypothetical protein FE257_009627 [Aspergillus nanangensis]|uniref:Uncharacterized protein n=1 Tax=Aspergillus nanangensis TaxID=2582783 RepID=A0AAD4CJY4_ASPNN|nr:hypothetical protein FE257_009627 [Aspergillus nanangensis]